MTTVLMKSKITLGGKSWTVPPLPWKICRVVEPVIVRDFFAIHDPIADGDDNAVDRLVGAVFAALHHVDPDLAREDLDALAFGRSELSDALTAVAGACGMKMKSAGAGDAKGELSTGTS